jgi:tetratricopeptide (TPR) repeat protein
LQLLAGDTAAATREIEEFLKEQPLESLAAAGRPAVLIAHFYAQAGQPERARDVLNQHAALASPELRSADDWLLRHARAEVMIASGNPHDALQELRPRILHVWRNEWFEEPFMPIANRPELARAYDLAGQADSAIVIFERYLNTRALYRAELDAFELAHAYQRLAALYEARSNFIRAAEYYRLLAQLWRNADPGLRRIAEEARLRAEQLGK